MKVTVAPLKNPNKGLGSLRRGEVVSCEAYPSTVYMVAGHVDQPKVLLNLQTGEQANPSWVEGQVWFVREAELSVK